MRQFRNWLVRLWLVRGWLVFLILVLVTSSIRAEDKPRECEPQPTCEFSNLVIKPGAQTPGIKPQDRETPALNLQGKLPTDLRDTYRLPEMTK
jgi:hypothetical protein